ncbi:Os01g0192101 [Oryza sativa Japonica Group]|uniref:Os01g0192101 protein n=1 Tax=Oryza sativa subsp. japonica TaxID=39947 RepID=A0A0P0UZB4_ORYSJ|nr:Os01g0192101 [Oryza sativa Japonica Group]
MAPPARAPPHLELVHPELVARVRVHRRGHRRGLLLLVSPHPDIIRRQVIPQRGDHVRRHLIPTATTAAEYIDSAHGEVRPRRDAADSFPHHHHGHRRRQHDLRSTGVWTTARSRGLGVWTSKREWCDV